jgi:hypothetical protein
MDVSSIMASEEEGEADASGLGSAASMVRFEELFAGAWQLGDARKMACEVPRLREELRSRTGAMVDWLSLARPSPLRANSVLSFCMFCLVSQFT